MRSLAALLFSALFILFLTNPGERLEAEVRDRVIGDALAEAERSGGRASPGERALFEGLARPALAAALSVTPQGYGLFTLYEVRGPATPMGRMGQPRRCLGAAAMLWACWAA
ncbi:MAG: hypothetical protein NZM27_02805 [Acetobacteraceae bacterium]|nr:hypothetical protein [Acetobacteraceae bacterium]MCX7684548.1 hypothetical protein [Acetobacteraceae bacterium]MDW8398021.1 hypothetical protein [Acetobacteraceae bacterium]